jgi:hypothetical protein
MRENPAAFGVGRKVKELVWSNHTAWSSEALGIKGVVYYIERMAKSAEWILYLNGSGMGIRRSKGKKADVISAAQTHYERREQIQFPRQSREKMMDGKSRNKLVEAMRSTLEAHGVVLRETELQAALAAVEQAIRDEVLETAAVECDKLKIAARAFSSLRGHFGVAAAETCASNIRALKGKPHAS